MELTTNTFDQSEEIERDIILDIAHYLNDEILYACRMTPAVIGITFNLLIIGTMIFVKRLHLPMNFTWLGIGISNICLLTSILATNLSSVQWKSSSSTRSLCAWFVTLSIANQSLSFFTSLVERQIFMTFPKWHSRHVTIVRLTVVQLSCSILLFLLGNMVNLPVFGEFLPQFFTAWNYGMMGTFILGLLPIILIGQMAIMKTKTYKHYPSIEVVHMQPRSPRQQPIYRVKRKRVLINNHRVNALDVEATQNVYFMGKVYLISIAPTIILFLISSICFRISDGVPKTTDDVNDSKCSSFIRVFYYSTVLLCIHSGIVNPIIYVYLSDLKSVLKYFCRHR